MLWVPAGSRQVALASEVGVVGSISSWVSDCSCDQAEASCMHACWVLQLCPTVCDPMDCNPRVSSVHGILQTRILVWLPCPPPGDLPNPRTEPMSLKSPALAGWFFTTSATWEALGASKGQSYQLSPKAARSSPWCLAQSVWAAHGTRVNTAVSTS